MNDWHTWSLERMAAALAARELSALELADHFLARIQASPLNAFIDVQPELTRAQARAASCSGVPVGLLSSLVAARVAA